MAEKLSKEGKLFESLLSVSKQWVNGNFTATSYKATYPIAFQQACYVAVANDVGSGCKVLGISGISVTTYCIYQLDANVTWFRAIFVGY